MPKKIKRFLYFIPLVVLIIFLIVSRHPPSEIPSKSTEAISSVLSEKTNEENENIIYGFPSTNCHILVRVGYDLCYNDKTKVADWTSYHLTDQYLFKHLPRTEDFRPDPDIPKGKRSELIDYRGSGFDRGHLVPAGDMGRSSQTMSESFLLTNMAPQVGPGFNRGIWKHLEEKVRHWAMERKNIYVFSGPLYLDENGNKITTSSNLQTIGPEKVWVPTHFYKVIVSVGSNYEVLDAIAFILPNKGNASRTLAAFITSIDEVERLSGLDFMPDLEDTIELQLEAQKHANIWQ